MKHSPGRTAEPISNARIIESIAILTRDIANDLAGFGSHVGEADRSRDSVRGRLITAFRELSRLRAQLVSLREPFVRGQISRIPAPGPSGWKIQIGGGGRPLAGWIDVDLPPQRPELDALSLNVLWGLPFARSSARFVFCSHALEHLDYPDASLSFLRSVRRVLRTGGVLRVVVPDLESYLAAYARRDLAFFRARRKTWPHSAGCESILEEALLYAGAAAPPEDFFGHKFGYDFETLKRILRKAGFRRVVRSAYMKSRHADLRVDSASPYARAVFRGRHFSLFVEATR